MGYLVPLSILRILLLLVPLLFHSYHGTALRFPTFYKFLYFTSLAFLLLHIVWLSLLNPQSLEAMLIIVTDYSNNKIPHLHSLRRIAWMLHLSLLSTVCHILCFRHVRSTAPHSSSWTNTPTVYFAVRHYNTQNSNNSSSVYTSFPHNNNNNTEMTQTMMNFMNDIQIRLQQTRIQWTRRLEDFSPRIAQSSSAASTWPAGSLTFRIMLQLFAQQDDVFRLGKLDQVYDMDDGASVMFFVPQIVTFLLHGALYCSPQLEDWILDKCRRNLYFAHRCYWFLRAWCLEVPSTASAAVLPGRLTSPNPSTDALYVDQPLSSESQANGNDRCGKVKRTNSTAITNPNDKFLLPEEREVIERLMLRVKECGEVAAREIETKRCPVETNEYYQSNYSIFAAQKGFLPISPTTHEPSQRHIDCLSTNQRIGFRPVQEVDAFHGETNHFDRTPLFLDSLINIADHLFTFPKSERKKELRRQLRQLECDLLPSNSVYMPAFASHNRIWRIVVDECIAISTKERVPCIIYLEAINDSPAVKTRPKGWKLSDQVPRQNPWITGDTGTCPPATDLNRSGSMGSHHESTDQTEQEMVRAWRTQKRHPLRRVPFIDVVRESVKGPIEHVKSKMKNFRDRSVSEEFQSLTTSDIEDGTTRTAITFDDSDLERGRLSPVAFDQSGPDMKRSDSGTSLETLGQWSSPTAKKTLTATNHDLPHAPSLETYGRTRPTQNTSIGLGYGNESNPQLDFPRSSIASPPSSRALPIVFKESWEAKQKRLRKHSAFGEHPGWQLLPILIKSNDDLRQEQLASQLIFKMASILASEKVPVWVYPYEIIALTDRGGIIEAIPDTISLDSLKRNDPNYSGLRDFFSLHYGEEGSDDLADAKANFIESLAAYSIICYLLQIKDRHNGNILIDNQGHIIHIDFGFFFLSSPGKNAGFESAPFKLTRDFMEVMDGPSSSLFRSFRELCIKSFISLRKHCMEIILLVEMLKTGNEGLNCFRGRPDDAIQQLRDRFRLDLNDRACREYVNSLIDDSIENWRTNWYDRYQRYFVGVL